MNYYLLQRKRKKLGIPLLLFYSEIRCIELGWDSGFFCSLNHFSEGGVNANHSVTCLSSLAENDSSGCSRIAKEIVMVKGFYQRKERDVVE